MLAWFAISCDGNMNDYYDNQWSSSFFCVCWIVLLLVQWVFSVWGGSKNQVCFFVLLCHVNTQKII
jgi:hypothetical protein